MQKPIQMVYYPLAVVVAGMAGCFLVLSQEDARLKVVVAAAEQRAKFVGNENLINNNYNFV